MQRVLFFFISLQFLSKIKSLYAMYCCLHEIASIWKLFSFYLNKVIFIPSEGENLRMFHNPSSLQCLLSVCASSALILTTHNFDLSERENVTFFLNVFAITFVCNNWLHYVIKIHRTYKTFLYSNLIILEYLC